MVSPHGTDSSRGWKEGVSTPATLMRLAAGAGREAQERTFIVHEAGIYCCRSSLRANGGGGGNGPTPSNGETEGFLTGPYAINFNVPKLMDGVKRLMLPWR